MNNQSVRAAQEIRTLLTTTYADRIDDSPYSLDDWVQTLLAFQAWASKEKRSLTFEHQVDYVACCIEGMNNPVPLMPLQKLWEDFITNYGVE